MSESAFSAYAKFNTKPHQSNGNKKASKSAKSKSLKRKQQNNTGRSSELSSKLKKSKTTATVSPKRKSFKTEYNITSSLENVNESSDVDELKVNPNANIDDVPTSSSIDDGKRMLSWILATIPIDNFMQHYWEQKPLLIKRKCPTYYRWLLSTESIDKMLREQRVEFTKNLDITSYRNGVRETHNPDGRAMAPVVWDFYNDGCSLRMLNPQTFIRPIHKCNAMLQEYFHCMTGANFYLTPPNSQGFAPHYDDIEAFILQIEGKKLWKLYKPITAGEYLPRVSSKNFDATEIGEPILETILEAGDCLYFPRGTIHQATTIPDEHSLHITLSVYQKQSYADLFELMMPMALTNVINENIAWRQGVPLDMWHNMGFVHEQQGTSRDTEKQQKRKIIKDKIKQLFLTMLNHLPIDDAIDRMAIRYQHDALPPVLLDSEKKRTIYGTSSTIDETNGTIDLNEITANTKVRLVRANILRLVRYNGDATDLRVYFYADNSREYHEFDENYLQIDENGVHVVEKLIKTYPEYIRVGDLDENDYQANDDDDDDSITDGHIQVVQCLWDRGLLMTKQI